MANMRPKHLIALACAAVLTVAANSPWHATVTETDRAQVIGNPEAEVELTEFVSYSCPACAAFAVQGEPALQMAYLGTGKVKLGVRSVIRNEVDLVATMLVQCGDSDKFVRNHTMFMLTQRAWLPVAQRASQSQVARWTGPDKSAARRAITNDLGFYALMESRGYSRPDIDQCLANQATAERLRANSDADREQFAFHSTPSFAIDGQLLPEVHDWRALETALNERLQ